MNESMKDKLQKAKEYLGTKWIIHPANQVKRKEKK